MSALAEGPAGAGAVPSAASGMIRHFLVRYRGRIVDWITEGRGEDVWRVVVALIVGAGGGASALIGLRRRSTNGVE